MNFQKFISFRFLAELFSSFNFSVLPFPVPFNYHDYSVKTNNAIKTDLLILILNPIILHNRLSIYFFVVVYFDKNNSHG